MKNIINFFYNFNVIEIYSINNGYYFNYNNDSYVFMCCMRDLNEINAIYNLYKELKIRNVFVNDLILNKNGQIVCIVDNKNFVLIKDNTKNNRINMNDLLYIQNNTVNIKCDKKIFRNNWIKMWEIKIDYYEKNINGSLKKYPLLNKFIDYYIGLGENAISYLSYNSVKKTNYVLSHKRININNSTFDFYNPLNFIIDSRVRDFSEYVKTQFFYGTLSFDEFKRFVDYMNLSREECILLISRLLFPTYFFDLYDSILNEEFPEENIKNVLDKKDEYANFLKNTFYYFINIKKINIPCIDWLIKY